MKSYSSKVVIRIDVPPERDSCVDSMAVWLSPFNDEMVLPKLALGEHEPVRLQREDEAETGVEPKSMLTSTLLKMTRHLMEKWLEEKIS